MKWKRVVAGLAGAAAAFMVGKKVRQRRQALPQPIPAGVASIRIETEDWPLAYRDQPYRSKAVYFCRPTRFKVWSLLRAGAEEREGEASPNRIYLVAPEVVYWAEAGDERKTLAEEKFYATIHYRPPGKAQTAAGRIARGAPLEFHKCHVGGSLNGVHTGEIISTGTPITAVEFLDEPPTGD